MAAMFAVTTPVLAAALPAWLHGEWCEENGEERMIADEFAFGFNEHTVCQVLESREQGDVATIEAKCANVYPNGDQVVRMDERDVTVQSGPDRSVVSVQVEDAAPVTFRRCED